MDAISTEQIPAAEMIRAEKMLTPEQRVQSDALYEVNKHLGSLMKAEVSEAQVQEAATFASETALKEYRDLINQNPWKTKQLQIFLMEL
jgi:histone H3/H4